jgi:hypothetical protein
MSCRGQSNPGQLGPHKQWWEEKLAGNVDVEYFDFPGNSQNNPDGKRAQANSALEWLSANGGNQNAPIYFGGYSAGGDAAILEAHDAFFIHGWDVQGLYVIDPGYGSSTVTADEFTQKLQELVNVGIPVSVHDAHAYMYPAFDQIDPESILNLDQKISGATFSYRYDSTYNHYEMDDGFQSQQIFEESYNFISTH